MTKPVVLLSVNTAWNAWNFRAGLISAILSEGYQVVVAAPADRYSERLTKLGCRFIDLPMDSNGMHPGRDVQLLLRYVRLLRSEAPVVYLGYTIKPNVYGSLAARVLGIPVINNIAGLGATFISKGLINGVVRLLYRIALRKSETVFFQNTDDRKLFTSSGLTRPEQAALLPGSGIASCLYQPVSRRSAPSDTFRFLLLGRMLVNKGVNEFVDAARIVRSVLPTVQFQLLGGVNEENPDAIPLDRLRNWHALGLVEYLGVADDVRPYIAAADCVVLPSYREGVPRTLLEAAVMAVPIIATDVPGCRAVVNDQVNGMLCRVRDPSDLAEKMIAMVRMTPDQRQCMGECGRQKVEREFDESIVIRKYLNAIAEITGVDNTLTAGCAPEQKAKLSLAEKQNGN